MMKWRTTQPNGRPLIGIGLEAGNIERLKRGEPIFFPGEELEIEGLDILVHYGDTKVRMAKDLEAAGIEVPADMKRKILEIGPEPGHDA